MSDWLTHPDTGHPPADQIEVTNLGDAEPSYLSGVPLMSYVQAPPLLPLLLNEDQARVLGDRLTAAGIEWKMYDLVDLSGASRRIRDVVHQRDDGDFVAEFDAQLPLDDGDEACPICGEVEACAPECPERACQTCGGKGMVPDWSTLGQLNFGKRAFWLTPCPECCGHLIGVTLAQLP